MKVLLEKVNMTASNRRSQKAHRYAPCFEWSLWQKFAFSAAITAACSVEV